MTLQKAVLLCALVATSLPALAIQNFSVRDGDSIRVQVSMGELTRFSMASGGRIVKIWGPDDRFTVEPDKDSGQLFIRLLDKSEKPFSVFVKDDMGATYTVLATPTKMPSDSVVLEAQAKQETSEHGWGEGAYSAANGRPYNWIDTVKNMMRGMALSNLGVNPEYSDSEVSLGLSGKLVLLERYPGDLIGEIYGFTASGSVTLDERMFESLGTDADVKAVAIDEHVLTDGQYTRIYVIKANGDDL